MALSLSAEQRSILQLFKGEEVYVIPDYQRPYSWGYDECYMLYTDLMGAFKDDMREYFVGNIVMAKYQQPRYERQVVDGQQRLTTIWIMLKILSVKCETINPLHKVLSVEAREGGEVNLKIQNGFDKDRVSLESVFSYDNETLNNEYQKRLGYDGVLNFSKDDSLITQAALNFYNWFSYFERTSGISQLKDFANYLLDSIFLLPIELYDSDKDEAVNKALTIFETINNRGKDLDNADIFKSKLYDRALTVHQQDRFTLLWNDFIQQCNQLEMNVDDIFRFYSHVIRGLEGLTQMEIKLRDLFVNTTYTPFKNKGYEEVMNDLFKIIDVLNYINIQKKQTGSECGKWFQVIDAYSNNYPLTALVVFLFTYGFHDEYLTTKFSKAVIRYAYAYGSTRSVKFGIYNLITTVARRMPFDDYCREGCGNIVFSSAGRIKEGFAMIAYYQYHPIVPNLCIDKWITSRDIEDLPAEWDNTKKEQLDSIGNYVILDLPKVNGKFGYRSNCYKTSDLQEVTDLIKIGNDMSYNLYEKRESDKRKSIEEFFKH